MSSRAHDLALYIHVQCITIYKLNSSLQTRIYHKYELKIKIEKSKQSVGPIMYDA